MEARILQHDKLCELVEELTKSYEVIAPKDELSYAQIGSAEELYLGTHKPARSLKGFLLPQRETLIGYRLDVGEIELVEPLSPAANRRIVFAACPCDAAALPILDHVFAWDPADSFYLGARERTIVVSLACEEPHETCFCISLGGSPAGIEGADLLLTSLGDVYHVQIITERGKALVVDHSTFFQESDQRRNRERARREDELREKVTKAVDVRGLDTSLDFDNPVWEVLAQECVDCGICTFLCPTCHCFDIQDEGGPDEGERVRLWDACVFYDYTKAYAGQPRPTHCRRYRQRIMHKFRYYPENFGRTLCVGCGRCIQYCPVSIDLTRVLEAVKG